jgi:hypothetical protein
MPGKIGCQCRCRCPGIGTRNDCIQLLRANGRFALVLAILMVPNGGIFPKFCRYCRGFGLQPLGKQQLPFATGAANQRTIRLAPHNTEFRQPPFGLPAYGLAVPRRRESRWIERNLTNLVFAVDQNRFSRLKRPRTISSMTHDEILASVRAANTCEDCWSEPT